jgi:hypothetical protein
VFIGYLVRAEKLTVGVTGISFMVLEMETKTNSL